MDDLAQQLLGSLDQDQQAAAKQLRGPVAIIAGPGSGKTKVVSHRIAYGIALGVYDPAKVLALTYTNRAAAELRTRLRSLGAAGVQVRTFHAAALGQLQYFWPQLTTSSAPKLVTAKHSLLGEAAEQIGLRLDSSELSSVMSLIEWHRYAMVEPTLETAARLESTVNPERFLELFRSFEQVKQEKRVIDWEDVLLLCIGLMRSEPRMLEHFSQQYRFFTVDEYQDISPLQQALLETWLGDRQELCVVGDPRQTIYSFAGASSAFLLNFEDRYPQAQLFELNRNYRSAVEVVALANSVMGSNLEAVRPLSSPPRISKFSTAAAEATAIANQANELVQSGVPLSEIAVLTRSNFQLDQIEQRLKNLGLSVQVRGAGRFFSRPEVSQAMVAIRALVASNLDKPLFAQISDIVSSLGWRSQGEGEKWQNLNWFFEVLDELGEAVSVEEYVRELQERERSGHEPTQQAITLATVHATKGLEWKVVFLAGMNNSHFPSSYAKTPEQLAEERRLYFVAITRAKEQLEISYSEDRGASEFLAI
jgi:DNA helicase II / ATP-dependent DNA helicase PcrA